MRTFRSLLLALVLVVPGQGALECSADTGTTTRVTDPSQHAVIKPGNYPYREKIDYVLKELDLRSGDVVVDVGAGDGWWTERMAKCVGPTGTVHAVEVEEKLVDQMKKRFAGLPHVRPCLCKPDDTLLPEKSCDLVFLSQVYHHLPKDGRVDYLRRLRKVAKPTGRLCVIERYSEIATKGKDHGTQLEPCAPGGRRVRVGPGSLRADHRDRPLPGDFVPKGLFRRRNRKRSRVEKKPPPAKKSSPEKKPL